MFSHAIKRHGEYFVLIGTPDEFDATEEVRAKMGPAADAAINLCNSPPSLPVTVALCSSSAGYIGRDTGPMHIAAALGKPVIAVFGGGHWPRFTPRAKTGFVASVIMPCAGCDWVCHLAEPYCVRRVPVESIVQAFDSVKAGQISGLQIQQFPIGPVLRRHGDPPGCTRRSRSAAACCRRGIRSPPAFRHKR